MPRQARLDAPGLLHHLIARGIERRNIFHDKTDRDEFLARIESSLAKSPNQILAWALMPNHFHLLVRSGVGGIADLMRRLMTGYAGAFNIRHWRAGHLFQNRYKSIVCENSPYLLELVRYIHLNPLRAGLVSSLDELQQYPWTGHSVLMGVAERPWQETMEVLSCFSKDIATARKNYETFLAEAKDVKSRRDLMVGGVGRRATGESPGEHDRTELSDERVLGSGGFVEEVLKRSQDKALARAMAWGGIPSLECLTKRVAEKAGVETNDLLAKGRTAIVSRAKAVLIYAGTEYLGKSIEEMAEVTEMSGQAAGKARMRGEGLLTEEEMRELVG